MLRVLRQFVHVVQNHFDPRDTLRLLVSQEVEAHETSAPTIRTLSRSDDAISWREAGFFEADHGEDGLVLNPEDAQRIVDELWVIGHRPSEAVGSAGALTAAHAHLADLRKVLDAHLAGGSPTPSTETTVLILGRLSFLMGMSKEINELLRERANTDATHWWELGERLNGIEFSLDTDGDITNKSIPEQIDSLRDDLAKQPGMVAECVFQSLSQSFENPNNAVHQRLVELGWTPPAKAEL